MHGIDNLLKEIAGDRIFRSGVPVLAIYDDDQIRRHLGMVESRRVTTTEDVMVMLSRRAHPGGTIIPRPIGSNLEALVGHLVPPGEREDVDRKASGGRALRQRDVILQTHARFAARASRSALATVSAEWTAIVETTLAPFSPKP